MTALVREDTGHTSCFPFMCLSKGNITYNLYKKEASVVYLTSGRGSLSPNTSAPFFPDTKALSLVLVYFY